MIQKEKYISHQVVYDMLYGGKYHIDFTDFKGIVEILLDSGSIDEFIMRYDIYGFNNKSLRNLLIDKVFEDGKE